MVSRIDDDAEFRALFDQTHEAHGLNVIDDGLLGTPVVVPARMWDQADPGSGQGIDCASLHHLMALSKDEDLVRIVVDEARSWIPGLPRMEDVNARTAARAIRRARVRYRRLTTREPGTIWLETRRTFHDPHIAHSLFDMDQKERLRYGYIGELLTATCEILEPLRLGVEGARWEVEDFRRERRNQADALISVLGKGMQE